MRLARFTIPIRPAVAGELAHTAEEMNALLSAIEQSVNAAIEAMEDAINRLESRKEKP